ncbi:MAG: hypothetical protein ACJAV1_001156 [Paraglaciecola sp.]|jgi:hypothetical protein
MADRNSMYTTPEEAFKTLLNHYWADKYSETYPYDEWKKYVYNFTIPAKQWLDQIKEYKDALPSNFVEFIQINGNLYLDVNQIEESSAYVNWLNELHFKMLEIYEEHLQSDVYAFVTFLQTFQFKKTNYYMLVEWKSYASKSKFDAQKMHSKMVKYFRSQDQNLVVLSKKWGGVELPDLPNLNENETYLLWLDDLVKETGLALKYA